MENMPKFNYKRTLLVGFAFFLICVFWQAYDNVIPKILTDKFGLSQTLSGIIMALDNILALFLLPFFGALSDKRSSKLGKRTPFIIVGTIAAAVLFVVLSFIDNAQLVKLENVTPANYEQSLEIIYEADPEISVDTGVKSGFSIGEAVKRVFSPDQRRKSISEIFPEKSDFLNIKMLDENGKPTADYTNYVVPARQAYAWTVTAESPATLIFFILLLLALLVSMGIFRSPAVALMPDVTIKPYRSKANAVINLMGSIGGIAVLVLGIVFGTGKPEKMLMSYVPFFIVIAVIMLAALAVFLKTVKEPKWAEKMKSESKRLGLDNEEKSEDGSKKLSRSELASLLFLLASVALWYMGYNAVTSKYSVYAGSVLGMDYNTTLIIAQGAAIVSYFPIGIISSKIGRKKTILFGIVSLSAAFFFAAFMNSGSSILVMNILFALAGIGWASINVNSYPMVVELAKGGNVGKYTGYYYTASMAAQVITPVLSGIFLDVSLKALFPYAVIFTVLSFVTMLFVKHGDSRPDAIKTAIDAAGND